MLYQKVFQSSLALGRAKNLRQRQNHVERMLWRKLRGNRFHGYKFRRQVPIGIYIVDFLCVEKNLIIELDGDSHYRPGAKEYDEKRDTYLVSRGFRVLRFQNHVLRGAMDVVLQKIREALEISPLPIEKH